LLFFIAKRKDHRAIMKPLYILFAAVCAAATAHADLVLQQQIITPEYNGVSTMKVKGAKVRMDLYAGQPQARSIIMDLDTGETIALMHSQKLYVRAAGQPMNQNRPASAASRAPIPHNTGKNQKVGGYDTELYTWSNARGITGTAWVAKNFPDYARIRADLAVLDKTTGTDNDTTPELNTLPGMVVRSQVAGSGQTITSALISAQETQLDASLFGIPRNYKEVPKVTMLQPVSTPKAPQTTVDSTRPTGASKAAKTTNTAGSPKSSGSSKTSGTQSPPANFSTQKPPEW
jgi:hypothetical protein